MQFLSIRFLINRLKAIRSLLRDKNVGFWKKALVVFGIIYLFLPVDLIPPIIFPFGFLDDLVLWIFIIWHLKDTLDTYWTGEKTRDYSKEFKSEKIVDDVEFKVDDEPPVEEERE